MNLIFSALEDVISCLDYFNINNWGDPEEEGGILSRVLILKVTWSHFHLQ